jgi:hypothetical protein
LLRASQITAAAALPGRPPRASARVKAAAKPVKEKIPLGTKFVYLMWTFILFDPQWYVAWKGPDAVTRIPTVLFAVMLLLVFFKPPKHWFPALLGFMLYTMAIVPFAYIKGGTFNVVKTLIAFYVLAVGTMAFVRNVRQAVPIITAAMLGQFLWYLFWGVTRGRVLWHPALFNYDSYGPLMVIGIGMSYFYGFATTNKKAKVLAFLTSIGCIMGLVSSFARGAVLGAALVVCWIFLRSNRKGATLAAGLIGGVVVVIAASLFSGTQGKGRSETGQGFFAEMATIFENSGTETDRKVLWALARRVWAENIIFGVGANNFGAYAAENFAAGTTGGGYNDNPGKLWGRQLHSTYFQILCEYGTIGSMIFLWVLWDFFKRNAMLRSKPFEQRWWDISGGKLHLPQLARGLETGMVGFLGTALFYNQIFDVHWLYTLVTINGVLWAVSKPLPKPRPERVQLRPA